MKFRRLVAAGGFSGRSPCGERGLKCRVACLILSSWSSLPVRGAWVEMILVYAGTDTLAAVAPRAGSVG